LAIVFDVNDIAVLQEVSGRTRELRHRELRLITNPRFRSMS
jgi:hypothetical protein